jgi:predicted CDP-diglyceride synthetase/phosphatidate cytidylyltransferase
LQPAKRDHSPRDWGNVIEAHSGVPDRAGSLVFGAPVFSQVRFASG